MDILTVETLAETLQELNRPLLTQGLRTLGPDRCAAILADTLTCQASGGICTDMCCTAYSLRSYAEAEHWTSSMRCLILICTVGLQSGIVEWDGISVLHPHMP